MTTTDNPPLEINENTLEFFLRIALVHGIGQVEAKGYSMRVTENSSRGVTFAAGNSRYRATVNVSEI